MKRGDHNDLVKVLAVICLCLLRGHLNINGSHAKILLAVSNCELTLYGIVNGPLRNTCACYCTCAGLSKISNRTARIKHRSGRSNQCGRYGSSSALRNNVWVGHDGLRDRHKVGKQSLVFNLFHDPCGRLFVATRFSALKRLHIVIDRTELLAQRIVCAKRIGKKLTCICGPRHHRNG